MDKEKRGRNAADTDAFAIFEEIFAEEVQSACSRQKAERLVPLPGGEDIFYEIEYDSGPFPGVGRFVQKSSKIEAPRRDEIREKFDRMRDIARENRLFYFNSSKFYDRRIRQENSRIFYLQGRYMEDFEDDYEECASYSAYYPSYQTMGYEQLRTYFTWRTWVRRGVIEESSLSYAFLYIYELLGLIGVKDEKEGLEKLVCFWDAYRKYDKTVDKYVPMWLKDYHIYYGLDESFREFVEAGGMEEYYPELGDSEDRFELLCSISKYDVRQSAFYGEGREEMIQGCFSYVMENLDRIFAQNGMNLEECVFQPGKNAKQWEPFKGALFYPDREQDDRTVVFSDKEIYFCSRNGWTRNTVLTTESGKKLLGYVMKQMEAELRKAVKYRHRLSASLNMLSQALTEELDGAGISLGEAVARACREFYREANKTVVRVDPGSLEKIRRESLQTQEKLMVPEEGVFGEEALLGKSEVAGSFSEREEPEPYGWQDELKTGAGREDCMGEENVLSGEPGPWEAFGNLLDAAEFKALCFILYKQSGSPAFEPMGENAVRALDAGDKDWKISLEDMDSWKSIRQFADAQGIMQEVLADGINEKAMDQTGDSLLDEEFMIYEDYIDQVKEMLEGIWRHRFLHE